MGWRSVMPMSLMGEASQPTAAGVVAGGAGGGGGGDRGTGV